MTRNSFTESFARKAILPAILYFIFIQAGFSQPAPLRIAVSKASPNYINWLKTADPGVETVDLYVLPLAEALATLDRCSGLLLTGGEDVVPGRYGKESESVRCTGSDPRRDTLELALIYKALKLRIPVFGICRGSQILNVALGGSLVVDIPTDIKGHGTHQCEDYLRCFHTDIVIPGTRLARIAKCDSAKVTTNHHQAADLLAPLLKVNARAPDGVAEGIEWKDPSGRSFLLGVQWHPERMPADNPLSGPLATEFLRQASIFATP